MNGMERLADIIPRVKRDLETGRKTYSDLVKLGVAAGAGNTVRPLTHSLEQARRG